VRSVGLVFAAVALGLSAHAAAASEPIVLSRLPNDKLAALAPLLAHGDMALVESNPNGTMKQVTVLLFIAAKPETVHDVITRPGDYRKFIPNLSRSTWERRPDGKMVSSWQFELPVAEFDGLNVYDFEPGPAGAMNVSAIDPNDESVYRWELLPVTGGTVLVQYGYTDVKHSNKFVRSFMQRQPTMEHGLALAAQLMLASPMRKEALRRTPPGSLPPVDTTVRSPGFNFLLSRGQVTIMRTREDGHLGDVSVLDRVFAPTEKIVQAITSPAAYARFIPGVDESYEKSRDGSVINYRVVMSVPLVSWNTSYAMRATPGSIEGIGTDGDLRGAHFKWDLTNRGTETMAVYRLNEPLAQSSLILRKLFESQPALERGIGVAFGLVYMRAMRGRAEGWGPK
jgi:hypothetical protein